MSLCNEFMDVVMPGKWRQDFKVIFGYIENSREAGLGYMRPRFFFKA